MNDSKIYKVLCADTGMWVTVRTKQSVRNSKKNGRNYRIEGKKI